MNERIPVIDLFAGPGGLGEGFASFQNSRKCRPFKIKLSIEKDYYAHQTLKLRSFFRQFRKNKIPYEYYEHLRGRLSIDELFRKYPHQAKKVELETWRATLGETPEKEIDKRVSRAIAGGDAWLLVGGPPCQAYSTVGRSRIRGGDRRNHTNNYETDYRHHLYREYLRILATHQPPVFVMENVKGILSSEIKGKRIFTRMLSDLKCPVRTVERNSLPKRKIKLNPEYKIFPFGGGLEDQSSSAGTEYIIRSEDYGVPQARHRVILLGIRSDLKLSPAKLLPSSKKKLADAISDLPGIRSQLSREPDSAEAWYKVLESIIRDPWFKKQPEKLRHTIRKSVQQLTCKIPTGKEFFREKYLKRRISMEKNWFFDSRLQGYCNHTSRAHIREDLKRYFFAACFARVYGRSPRISEFPRELYPNHRSIHVQSSGRIIFYDRFRVQIPDVPSTTIVSHLSQDGHYFIHPDPMQCRSFTVREAARIQTFPDNYFFEGPRTEQYQQVGNAVPPLLARQIAEIVYGVFRGIR
jgi:DNA (cytosine-5)-methyltransferase 1